MIKQVTSKKRRTTFDEFNPRASITEIKCDGCKEWFKEDDIMEAGEKNFCEDCHAHWECPSCGHAEFTTRNSCGMIRCDNCCYEEDDE